MKKGQYGDWLKAEQGRVKGKTSVLRGGEYTENKQGEPEKMKFLEDGSHKAAKPERDLMVVENSNQEDLHVFTESLVTILIV